MKNRILKDIKLIIYDFDGVMTDNRITLREDGVESVTVNRSDGLAVGIIKHSGLRQMIVSTETNRVVSARAKKIGIPAAQGVDNKKEYVESYCRKERIPLNCVVYVGNDLNDMEVMRLVGYPVCPADACTEVKKIAKIVLKSTGGSGVVHELLDFIKLYY